MFNEVWIMLLALGLMICQGEAFCINNSNNCQLCLNSLQCASCFSNYILVDGFCICPIQNCVSCAQNNTCSQCLSNLLPIKNNTQCGCSYPSIQYQNQCYLCQVENCTQCSANNTCISCQEPLTPQDSVCVCPNNSILISGSCICQAPYIFNMNMCIYCTIPKCILCESTNTCSVCQPSFILINNQCLGCDIENCTTCLINFCETCSAPLVPNSQGTQCILCQIPGCLACSSENQCYVCSNGLQVNQEKTQCLNCSINGCLICESNNVCSICFPTFVLNKTTNNCVPCIYPCKTCIQGQAYNCSSCFSPFSSSPNSLGICYTCSVPNCKSCQQFSTQCKQCNPKFQLINSLCIETCLVQFCLQCSSANNNICMQCDYGYVVINGNCVKCSGFPSCLSCNPLNISQCLTCNVGFYSSESDCIPCQNIYCAKCNAKGCIQYKPQIRLTSIVINNSTIQAYSCPPGCLKCSHINYKVCIKCLIGFSLSQQSYCVRCSAGCRTCNSSNTSYCFTCYPNQFLIDGACVGCNPDFPCLTCNPNNLSYCYTCLYGLVPNAQGQCAYYEQCNNLCSSCFNGQCQSCIDGYTLIGSECVPCLYNCIKCSSQNILLC